MTVSCAGVFWEGKIKSDERRIHYAAIALSFGVGVDIGKEGEIR